VSSASPSEAIEDRSDTVVERAHHRGVDAHALVGDVGNEVVVLLRGLQRRVRRVVREVEEERAVAVAVDLVERNRA
jgi:hypothetical protein